MPSILAPDIQETAPGMTPADQQAMLALIAASQGEGNPSQPNGNPSQAPKAPSILAPADAQMGQNRPLAPRQAPAIVSSTAPEIKENPPLNGPTNQLAPPISLQQPKSPSLIRKALDIHNPLLRVLGTAGAGIATGLRDYADARFPRLMAEIPGTPIHNEVQQDRQQALADEQAKRQFEEAETIKDLNAGQEKFSHFYEGANGVEYGVRPDGSVVELPTPKDKLTRKFQMFTIPGVDQPIQGYTENGEPYLSNGEQAPANARPYQKPPVANATQVPGVINGKPSFAWKIPGKTGFYDENGNKIEGFTPPPTYAEVAPAMQTQRLEAQHVTLLGPNGEQEIYTYNPATRSYTNPQGEAVSGAEGSRVLQAGHVIQAGQNLIDFVQAHPELAGHFDDYAKAAALGTPLSDPNEQYLASLIGSFAALNPAMHGFRSIEALKTFEKLMGGITNNPQSIVSGVQGMMQTAQTFNPNAGQHPTGGPRAQKQSNKGVVSATLLSQYAKKHSMTPAKAKTFLQSQGYEVQ